MFKEDGRPKGWWHKPPSTTSTIMKTEKYSKAEGRPKGRRPATLFQVISVMVCLSFVLCWWWVVSWVTIPFGLCFVLSPCFIFIFIMCHSVLVAGACMSSPLVCVVCCVFLLFLCTNKIPDLFECLSSLISVCVGGEWRSILSIGMFSSLMCFSFSLVR